MPSLVGSEMCIRDRANDLGVMIVLVTHRRKMETADFLDGVMGSVGIVANADVVLSIQRQRGENEAVLFCEGNDIESKQLALRFESNPLGFTLSDASPAEIGQTQERRAILDALRELGGTAKTGEIAALLGKDIKNISKLLLKLKDEGLIYSTGYGQYSDGRTGRTGRTGQQVYTGQQNTLRLPDSIDGRTGRTDNTDGEPDNGTSPTSPTSPTSTTSLTSPAIMEEVETNSESVPTDPPKIRLGKPRADWPAIFKNDEDGDELGIF